MRNHVVDSSENGSHWLRLDSETVFMNIHMLLLLHGWAPVFKFINFSGNHVTRNESQQISEMSAELRHDIVLVGCMYSDQLQIFHSQCPPKNQICVSSIAPNFRYKEVHFRSVGENIFPMAAIY